MARHPILPIAELQEGSDARIVGRVEPASATLIAPLSGRRCVLHHSRVGSLVNATNATEIRAVPFWIVGTDGSRVLIEETPTYLASEDFYERVTGRSLPGRLRTFVRRHEAELQSGQAATVQSFIHTGPDSGFSFVEGAIEVGEHVSALGRVRLRRDSEAASRAASYRDSLPLVTSLGARAAGPVLVSDRIRHAGPSVRRRAARRAGRR